MKKIFYSLLLILLPAFCLAQPVAEKPAVLYGIFNKEAIQQAPFDKWFTSGYATYNPDTAVLSATGKLNWKGVTVQVFLGTWCGDSKREVPRFLKIMDQLSVPPKNIQMIGLGGDSLVKQSPQHEEAGKGIFRVPVFIIYKNGVELGRINEYPVISLEKDIYALLSNQPYVPNYKSFATIKTWLSNGSLLDKNSSLRGMAMQLRSLVASEHELNSLGYLLFGQDKKEEGMDIFQINAILYPESANVLSSLGEGYYKTGDTKTAVQILERSLEINKDPRLFKSILNLLYEAKGAKAEN